MEIIIYLHAKLCGNSKPSKNRISYEGKPSRKGAADIVKVERPLYKVKGEE